ncbi:MAG: thioredoxin-dependent thiol peroxidase [Bdellovibrionales bacterium]
MKGLNAMSELTIGDSAPDFTLPANGDTEISLSSLRGQKVIVYFYPKDDTPGCTKQACGFSEALSNFNTLNTQIIGISKDSVKKHDKFVEKYNLKFPLASDEETTTCEDYGVWKEKNMYGKTYMGIERSTFIVDEDGKIEAVWHKVKVPGHIEAVQEALQDKAKAA